MSIGNNLVRLEKFAKERRLYHKRRARRYPEEYPDYRQREEK